jgi:sialidase-1
MALSQIPFSILLFLVSIALTGSSNAASPRLQLSNQQRERCLKVLRAGLHGKEFWPSIHAAEALTLAGQGAEVRRFLEPKLKTETDDQHRCGLARELVRAGDVFRDRIMLDILAGKKTYGHVHAAESLFKVGRIGDGHWMRKRFAETKNDRLKIMAAAALGKCGNPRAMAYLRKTLGHTDMETARIAAWVLARIGDKTDIPRLNRNRKRAMDDLTRAYFDNALALLGDDAGRKRLLTNLNHKDAAVRTYSAVFAGEAGMQSAAKRLQELLADSNVDVRIRAAQALIVLSKPASQTDRGFAVDVFPATKSNPRYSEGSIIELADGSLLFAITEFIGSGSDFAKAQIIARRSTDGGRTWGKPRVLQENVGGRNVMSVTLRRLPKSGSRVPPIGLFYLVKNSFSNLLVYLRVSRDEGKSFGKPIRVTTTPGYHVLNNDRVTVLSSGRILVPVATTADVRKVNRFVSWCFLSDDGGKSWRPGKGKVGYARRGAMEPEVLELNDGRVLMIVRTQLGHIAAAYSTDGGDTWSKPADWGVKAPEAPATLRRIPSTGDLLLIWNNTFRNGSGHGGNRTPLTAAVSSDEGKTWRHVRDIETRSDQTYAYTSLTFIGPRAVMSYYVRDEKTGRISTRFRSLPVSWFE